MNCTLCEGANTEVAFLKDHYNILHCKDCNHFFTGLTLTNYNINEVYSDDYFFGGGDGYDNYTLQKNMLIKRGEYYADKISAYTSPGKVLDVGSAAGFILKGFENKSWIGTGIEPNASMAKYGRQVLGVNVKEGTLETVALDKKYDLITIIQVIAHLNDVKGSINKLATYLKPGGHVLIETWNKDSLTAKIFGQNWHEFSPPSTLNYFSKKTLREMMGQYHFSVIAEGRPSKKIYSRHAKSFIKHKLTESKKLKWLTGVTSLIPENIILPYPAEDLFWFLFKRDY